MPQIIINKLGPIDHCELDIKDLMIFTGQQASGKSTIAKSVFFFKNVKNVLYAQLRKRCLLGSQENTLKFSVKKSLIRDIRSNFLQTFGSTWCMDRNMSLQYEYTDGVWIKISLTSDPISPNYIWVDISAALSDSLQAMEKEISLKNEMTFIGEVDIIKGKIITEKSSDLAQNANTYTFSVDVKANKIQIKQAIEEIFKVKVASVNTVTVRPKDRRVGRYTGKTNKVKKAIVKLKEGSSIELN